MIESIDSVYVQFGLNPRGVVGLGQNWHDFCWIPPKIFVWQSCVPTAWLNIAAKKWWLEDYFPIGKVTFQGLCSLNDFGKLMTEQVFSSIWPNISTNMDFPWNKWIFPSQTRAVWPCFWSREKFDQRNLRGWQSNPKSWPPSALLEDSPHQQKSDTTDDGLENPGVHQLRWRLFIPSFTKVSAPSNICLTLGFLNQPSNRTKKKRQLKKTAKGDSRGTSPDLNDALKFLQLIFLLLQSHHQVFWNHLGFSSKFVGLLVTRFFHHIQ